MIGARYSDILNNLSDYTFHILGCGAIGSSAAVQLVRMGATSLCLYDYDSVEEENIGVSQYNHSNIGDKKVEALSKILKEINKDVSAYGFDEKLEKLHSNSNDIVILGFDSMKSRLDAVESICKSRKKPLFMIDGRMGAEHYQQYIFKKPTLNSYKKTWYSDEEGDPERCSAKATSYCSNMSGSFISNVIRKLCTRQPYDSFLSFHFPSMTMERVMSK